MTEPKTIYFLIDKTTSIYAPLGMYRYHKDAVSHAKDCELDNYKIVKYNKGSTRND